MDTRIRDLLAQMSAIEDELRTALRDREQTIAFTIKGRRIHFEQSIREAHLRLKSGIYQWLAASRPRNMLSAPFIYAMFFPIALFDLCISAYQAICFPLYGVAKARRGDYIVFDRQHLGYLNFIERFHCSYCSYANGVIAYAFEIAARTEQYWCPIKHAHKVLGAHARHAHFLDFGAATDYALKLEEFRAALREKGAAAPGGRGPGE